MIRLEAAAFDHRALSKNDPGIWELLQRRAACLIDRTTISIKMILRSIMTDIVDAARDDYIARVLFFLVRHSIGRDLQLGRERFALDDESSASDPEIIFLHPHHLGKACREPIGRRICTTSKCPAITNKDRIIFLCKAYRLDRQVFCIIDQPDACLVICAFYGSSIGRDALHGIKIGALIFKVFTIRICFFCTLEISDHLPGARALSPQKTVFMSTADLSPSDRDGVAILYRREHTRRGRLFFDRNACMIKITLHGFPVRGDTTDGIAVFLAHSQLCLVGKAGIRSVADPLPLFCRGIFPVDTILLSSTDRFPMDHDTICAVVLSLFQSRRSDPSADIPALITSSVMLLPIYCLVGSDPVGICGPLFCRSILVLRCFRVFDRFQCGPGISILLLPVQFVSINAGNRSPGDLDPSCFVFQFEFDVRDLHLGLIHLHVDGLLLGRCFCTACFTVIRRWKRFLYRRRFAFCCLAFVSSHFPLRLFRICRFFHCFSLFLRSTVFLYRFGCL